MKNFPLLLLMLCTITSNLFAQRTEFKIVVAARDTTIGRSNNEALLDSTGLGGVDTIKNLSLYQACFGPYNHFLLMGGSAKVVFAKEFKDLDKGYFQLTYKYEPEGRDIVVKLPIYGQTVTFSKKVIFEDQGIHAADVKKLCAGKEAVKKLRTFTGFKLHYYDKEKYSFDKELERPLEGFIFPDDDSLLETVSPVMKEFCRKAPTMMENIVASRRIYLDQLERAKLDEQLYRLNRYGAKKPFNTRVGRWLRAFEEVMIAEVRLELVDKYGYNFENNLRTWLANYQY